MHAMRTPVAGTQFLYGGNYIHRPFSFFDGDNNKTIVSLYFRLTAPGKDFEHAQNAIQRITQSYSVYACLARLRIKLSRCLNLTMIVMWKNARTETLNLTFLLLSTVILHLNPSLYGSRNTDVTLS